MSTGNFPVSQIRFENVGRATKAQSACILRDWCSRTVNVGDSVKDNWILVQACSSTHETHPARNLCGIHIFRCLSEEGKQLSLETKYLERKKRKEWMPINIVTQKCLNCDPGFQESVWSWVYRKQCRPHYPCFNHHRPWHHRANRLFSPFSSSPHGKWLPTQTKQVSSIRILCSWGPWREKKVWLPSKTYWNFCKWFYKWVTDSHEKRKKKQNPPRAAGGISSFWRHSKEKS